MAAPPLTNLTKQIAAAFPTGYVRQRIKLALPASGLNDDALRLIAQRRAATAPDLWTVLGELCRPNDGLGVWQQDTADEGFLALLDLFSALSVADRVKTEDLLNGLRGDPDSRLLPAIAEDGGRTLLPVPNPEDGAPGRRSRLVMAHVRRTDGIWCHLDFSTWLSSRMGYSPARPKWIGQSRSVSAPLPWIPYWTVFAGSKNGMSSAMKQSPCSVSCGPCCSARGGPRLVRAKPPNAP